MKPCTSTTHETLYQAEIEMSPFAESLVDLMDNSSLFTRDEWAKFMLVKPEAIDQWLNDEKLPRPMNLSMMVIVLEHSSDVVKEPLERFKQMAALDAREVSPLGNQMLPNVWEYAHRPAFSELSSKLAKLSPKEQGELLETLFPEDADA